MFDITRRNYKHYQSLDDLLKNCSIIAHREGTTTQYKMPNGTQLEVLKLSSEAIMTSPVAIKDIEDDLSFFHHYSKELKMPYNGLIQRFIEEAKKVWGALK